MSQSSSTSSSWWDNTAVFRRYLWKYRRFYLIGLVSLIIVDVLEIFPPLILKALVDGLSLNNEKNFATLVLECSAMYVLVALGQGAMRFAWRRFIIRTSMFASHDMRIELFDHLLTLSPGYFKKKKIGDLVSLATNDIEAVRFSLGPGTLIFFDALLYFITIPPIMFWISPKLTVLSLIPLLLTPFFVRKMEKIIQEKFSAVQNSFAQLAAQCQESLSGVRLIKAGAIESQKENEFIHYGEDYLDKNIAAVKSQAQLSMGLDSFLSVATTILFLIGGAAVLQDSISVGVFVAFQRYIQKMTWPMEAFGMALNIFQRAFAAQKRVDAAAHTLPAIVDGTSRIIISPQPSISVKNLSFSYDGGKTYSLKNISFSIQPGEKIGIAGGIGSGKSTLLSCLARLESVSPDSIYFDNTDVTSVAISEIRSRVSYVPQESFLFSRTLYENILYGRNSQHSQSQEHEAVNYAEIAAINKEISKFPNGYKSVLGERGLNISGGQRQRISIARALAREKKILLLDDCLSAIDSVTEEALVKNLLDFGKELTLIVSTHRISTFKHFDKVLVLKNGSVIDFGKPAELLHSNSELIRLQKKQAVEELGLLQ
ncbi:MAG: ABC transporter ATP-binding protein/permease [Oligoflexia bacterium]|nr:ABC transporter ATP-binding protein/permease [Oligoflexia bacterium]